MQNIEKTDKKIIPSEEIAKIKFGLQFGIDVTSQMRVGFKSNPLNKDYTIQESDGCINWGEKNEPNLELLNYDLGRFNLFFNSKSTKDMGFNDFDVNDFSKSSQLFGQLLGLSETNSSGFIRNYKLQGFCGTHMFNFSFGYGLEGENKLVFMQFDIKNIFVVTESDSKQSVYFEGSTIKVNDLADRLGNSLPQIQGSYYMHFEIIDEKMYYKKAAASNKVLKGLANLNRKPPINTNFLLKEFASFFGIKKPDNLKSTFDKMVKTAEKQQRDWQKEILKRQQQEVEKNLEICWKEFTREIKKKLGESRNSQDFPRLQETNEQIKTNARELKWEDKYIFLKSKAAVLEIHLDKISEVEKLFANTDKWKELLEIGQGLLKQNNDSKVSNSSSSNSAKPGPAIVGALVEHRKKLFPQDEQKIDIVPRQEEEKQNNNNYYLPVKQQC